MVSPHREMFSVLEASSLLNKRSYPSIGWSAGWSVSPSVDNAFVKTCERQRVDGSDKRNGNQEENESSIQSKPDRNHNLHIVVDL